MSINPFRWVFIRRVDVAEGKNAVPSTKRNNPRWPTLDSAMGEVINQDNRS